MSTNNLDQIVIEAVYSALGLASDVYHEKFPINSITFDLKGRAAGQVRFPLNRKGSADIRFNRAILSNNHEQFLKEVVPHECAHLVVYHLYQQNKLKTRQRPKPHGKEWQSVMRHIYGLEPRVTHTFDVPKSTMKQFPYLCACDDKIHQLSIIRHNKCVNSKASYSCRRCGNVLRLKEQEYC